MRLYELEKQLRNRFPDWKVTAYDVPDMWSGVDVKTKSNGSFDVKPMSDNSVFVDHGRNYVKDELDLLVDFLKSKFSMVQPRLI